MSKLTYPTLQHCLRMMYTQNGNSNDGQSDWKPVSSELHKIILAKVQKGYKLLLKKIKSAFPVKMHIYMMCPSLLQSFTKFCWAVSEEMCWKEKPDWLTDRSKTIYTLRNSLRGVYLLLDLLVNQKRLGTIVSLQS